MAINKKKTAHKKVFETTQSDIFKYIVLELRTNIHRESYSITLFLN